MNREAQEALQRPFDASQVRSRRGPGGREFSFVPCRFYIDRLNELPCSWQFVIEELSQIGTSDMLARGHLIIDGERRSDVGGASMTVTRDGEVIEDIPNLAKKAVSDLLKRCARHYGLGRALWDDDKDSRSNPRPAEAPRRSNGRGPNGSNGRSKPSNGNGRSRLTQKQLSAIWGMARSLGRSVDEVRNHTVDAYGVQPEQMSKSDASNLITELGEALSQIGGAA